MASKRFTDRDFQKLAERIKRAIKDNEGLIGDQKDQVERLVTLEREFRHCICQHNQSTKVYQLFIHHICEEVGNILTAQSFFREKSKVFRKDISPLIKTKDAKGLMEFDINYKFIKFIVENWKGKFPAKANNLYIKLVDARRILIENNLPLAINRAKIFYKKTPKNHLSLLDLIDICVYGLIVGVDKYADNYSTVWRSVGIGRMVGFMIEEYSKSFIRLFPSDRKILYRANSLRHRLKIDNISELTDAVNESFQKDKDEGRAAPALPIKEIQIRNLLNSSGYVSASATLNDGEESEDGGSIYDYSPSEVCIEEEVEQKDLVSKVYSHIKKLNTIEQKIIKLKGVDI
jgi:DNA-directed RNA polymerase specialized sigma subunit